MDENDKTQAPVTPPTEAERFDSETAEFRTPGSVPDEPVKDKLSDKPAGQGGDKDAAGNADTGADADDAAAKAAAAAEDPDAKTDAKAGEGEGGKEGEPAPKEGDVPAWMKTRLARSKANETAAETRAREAEEEAQRLREENASLKTKVAPAKEPDPDDFETQAEYDEAKTAWKKAKDAPAPAPAPAPKKETPPANPLGITKEDLVSAVGTLETNLPPTVIARLKDEKQVQSFPAAIILEISEEADGAQQLAMARFVIGNQKIMANIAKLPARSQASAFVRAFGESTPAAAKKISSAPDPIKPANGNNGQDESTSVPALSGASFEDFEAAMDDYDRKRGARRF